MENAFFAMKVTFVNEMFDISQGLGVNFNKAREVWLEDPRIGRSHTFVFEDERGYGGKCLPKDMQNLITQSREVNVEPEILESIANKNKKYRR